MDPQELVPLEAGQLRPQPRPHARNCHLAPRSCYRAPLRLCRLLALLIVLPSIFIFVPLYLRYRVFSGQMYPMSMTDMRLIDSKISPTWCQRQVVKSNATFNAFVVPGPPQLSEDLVPVSMTRELDLEDDMKEYWGFYLLKGSSVTVSACVRWPGASLIMIKGYKHLQECAYIGDDSSEELDELIEAYNNGLLTNDTLTEKIQELRKEEQKANNPDTMRRHRAGVSFHDPAKVSNSTSSSSESIPAIDVTDHDPKELREILERLHALREAVKNEQMKYYQLPSHLMSLPALHRHRDANVDRNERRWLSFKDIDGNNSETTDLKNPTLEERNTSNTNISPKSTLIDTNITHNVTNTNKKNTAKKINNAIPETQVKKPDEVEAKNGKKEQISLKLDVPKTVETKVKKDNIRSEVAEVKPVEKPQVTERPTTEGPVEGVTVDLKEVNTNYGNPTSSAEANSKEVFEDVLHRLQALGDKGKRVLKRLHESMGVAYEDKPSLESPSILSAVRGSSEELDHLRNILVEAIDEEKNRSERQQKRRTAREEARAKRELLLGQLELQRELNEDDEARDYAAEEGLAPDEFAEHHEKINETTSIDMSNSEFWSSFSSSEEALLECEGLILNLPLTPHSNCHKDAGDNETFSAARVNALTYRVPANGYYFFVFNSENEVQRNYIRARFQLQKTRYDVARTALRQCTNTTQRCDLPLDIFSAQKVVLEVPLRNNDSLWNEQFVIISECEPRTSVYMVCVIAVPILIMMFAFQ